MQRLSSRHLFTHLQRVPSISYGILYDEVIHYLNQLTTNSDALIKRRAETALKILNYLKDNLRLSQEILNNIMLFVRETTGKSSVKSDDLSSIYLMASSIVYLFNDVRVLFQRNVNDNDLRQRIKSFYEQLFSSKNLRKILEINRGFSLARRVGITISNYEKQMSNSIIDSLINSQLPEYLRESVIFSQVQNSLRYSMRGEIDVYFAQTLLFQLVSEVDRNLINEKNNIRNVQLSFFLRDYGDSNAILLISLNSANVSFINPSHARTYRLLHTIIRLADELYNKISTYDTNIQKLVYEILNQFYEKVFGRKMNIDSEKSKKVLINELLISAIYDQKMKRFSNFLDYLTTSLSSNRVEIQTVINNSPSNRYWLFNVHESLDQRITDRIFNHTSFVSEGIETQLSKFANSFFRFIERIDSTIRNELNGLLRKKAEIEHIISSSNISEEIKKLALKNLDEIFNKSYQLFRARLSSLIERIINLSIDRNCSLTNNDQQIISSALRIQDLPISILFSLQSNDQIIAILSNGNSYNNFIGRFNLEGNIESSGAIPPKIDLRRAERQGLTYSQHLVEVKKEKRELKSSLKFEKIPYRHEKYYLFEYGRAITLPNSSALSGSVFDLKIRVRNNDYRISIRRNNSDDSNNYPYILDVYDLNTSQKISEYKISRELIFNEYLKTFEIKVELLPFLISQALENSQFKIMASTESQQTYLRVEKEKLKKGLPLFKRADGKFFCFSHIEEERNQIVLYDSEDSNKLLILTYDEKREKTENEKTFLEFVISREELESKFLSEIVIDYEKVLGSVATKLVIRGIDDLTLNYVDKNNNQKQLSISIYRNDDKFFARIGNNEIEISDIIKFISRNENTKELELNVEKLLEKLKDFADISDTLKDSLRIIINYNNQNLFEVHHISDTETIQS
ncbi:MAG: hypothetical protein QXF76_03755, partial [Candidatus Anstonellales archaeon]